MIQVDERQADIDLLNAFLCRERSAYEAYRICLEIIADQQMCGALTRLRASHCQSVGELDRRIRATGGTPCAHSSTWRVLSRVIEDSPGRLDNRMLLLALQEYSGRMLRSYRRNLSHFSPDTRQFVVRQILPQSQYAHASFVSLEVAV